MLDTSILAKGLVRGQGTALMLVSALGKSASGFYRGAIDMRGTLNGRPFVLTTTWLWQGQFTFDGEQFIGSAVGEGFFAGKRAQVRVQWKFAAGKEQSLAWEIQEFAPKDTVGQAAANGDYSPGTPTGTVLSSSGFLPIQGQVTIIVGDDAIDPVN